MMRAQSLAIGLALLAAGTVVGVSAQEFASAEISSGDRPVFVPIDSCRLVDTRPGDANVGPRSSALGPAETLTVDAQELDTACTGVIPTEALSLALNVTSVGATERSFLTIWAGGARPNASSLNPAPGEPPTPNAVTVNLSVDQDFMIYNDAGAVDIIVDVTGYYENHNHDDRYALRSEVQALLEVPPVRQRVVYQSFFNTPGTATPNMTFMRRLGTFTSFGGLVRIEWSSSLWALGDPSDFCNFGIRVNGEASSPTGAGGLNGTEAIVYGSDSARSVSTLDIFLDLPEGTHDLELYYRSNDVPCIDNFGGFQTTAHITETAN